MAVFQINRSQLLLNLDQITLNEYDIALVRLYTNAATPDPDMSLGDFTEASWTGYAPQSPVVWSAAALTGDIAFSDSALMTFPVTSGGTGTTVFGYFVTDGTPTRVMFAELLTTPVVVVDGIPILLQIRIRERNP